MLRRYGQDLGVANFAQAVFKTLAERRLDPAADRDPEPERSPVFIDGSDDSSSSQDPKWSNPRLFVSPY